MSGHLIAIADCGTSAEKIKMRLEEAGVPARIVSCTDSAGDIFSGGDVIGVVLSGSYDSVYEKGSAGIDPGVFSKGVPVLGICYGIQLEAYILGGTVEKSGHPEFGDYEIEVIEDHPLISGIDGPVSMSHNDLVTKVPEGFKVLCRTEDTPIAAIADDARDIYGVQFHPERSEATVSVIQWFARHCLEKTGK
ncbi:MAG: glutamine amidotransferase-related protein [Oscillospiraceae bacterium]|jgi:GMP synthase (glutamine-hydrolysing)